MKKRIEINGNTIRGTEKCQSNNIGKYRFDHAYDSVYEYDENQKAYLFVGKLLGRTEENFIRDIEEMKEFYGG